MVVVAAIALLGYSFLRRSTRGDHLINMGPVENLRLGQAGFQVGFLFGGSGPLHRPSVIARVGQAEECSTQVVPDRDVHGRSSCGGLSDPWNIELAGLQ